METAQVGKFLRGLAQNDYMIDQHMLPAGYTLQRVAETYETMLRALTLARATLDQCAARMPRAGVNCSPALTEIDAAIRAARSIHA